jgi:hypothetical protein
LRYDTEMWVIESTAGGILITLVKLVLSRMDDDGAARFAAQLATLLVDLRRTLQPLTNNGGTKSIITDEMRLAALAEITQPVATQRA